MSGLTRNQQRALSALLASSTVAEAAKKAKLTERTLYRFLADPTFKAELRQRQDEITVATTAALVGMSCDAIKTLRDLMVSPQTPASVRARVALGWLKHCREAIELNDLTRRLQQLETTLADLTAARRLENGRDDEDREGV